MPKRINTLDILARKGGTPIVALTCYTASMAKLLDAHVDLLLVGDSLGMVLYGMESTLAVTLEMMIRHGKAVASASSQALVVVDMPFGSYQASKEDAFRACARVLSETGAHAVKLEGGKEMAETIRYVVDRGIPVIGHIGLMPQHVHALGGYRFQGRNDSEAAMILQHAQAIDASGAFAMVIEGVKEEVVRRILPHLTIPAIGIGASPACDGQVLVIDDMLGLTLQVPGFVKRYGNLAASVEQAVQAYAQDVRSRAFPGPEYCFPYKKN